jgi:hypothetical protein
MSGSRGGGTILVWFAWGVRYFLWFLDVVVLWPVRRLFERLLIATSRYRELHGIPVGVFEPEAASPLWDKVGEALALIERLDQRRFLRFKRDVRRIIVVRQRSNRFLSNIMTCLLSQEIVHKRSATVVAVILAHEGTHARLEASGIRYGIRIEDRVEEVCVREEISFARRLPREHYPNLDEFIEYLGRTRDENRKSEWWGRRLTHVS